MKRTHPDLNFFSGDTPFAKANQVCCCCCSLRHENDTNITDLLNCKDPVFQEALRNILIVFAKLNPGIRYVQGMNELLAPLFYVLKNDPDEENAVSK